MIESDSQQREKFHVLGSAEVRKEMLKAREIKRELFQVRLLS